MKLSIPAGTTSKRVAIFIQDSSSTTGAGKSGLAFNTSSLTCYQWIDTDGNSAGSALTLATATLGTFTSSGFKEKDATNMPGWYEFGVPNAAIASGVKWACFHFQGATNMAPLPIEIEVTAISNQDAVRGGMTALPNANAEAAGGLYTRGSGAGQIAQSTNGQIDVDAKKINSVATTSVTTVNANVGTTQPENFTGTGASALVKCDVVDIAGAAVSATTAQLGVNVVQVNAVATSSVTTVSANQGTTQPVNFTGSGASALVKGDTVDWAGAAVAAVNVSGVPKVDVVDWLGTAPLALSSQQVQAVVPASTVVASVTGAVGSVTGAVGSVTGNVGGSVASVTGNVGGNVVGSVASVTAAVAITSNIKKNQALGNFEFLMTDSTNHNPSTGLAVTVTRSIDGGAFAAGTLSAVTEIASGMYAVNFGAGDLNGNVIVLKATAAASDTRFERIVTQP